MSYPTGRADRYRKSAEELSRLAESASSEFIRGYYQRTAERCRLMSEGEEAPLPKWATAGAQSESSTPLSDEVITSVPDQAMLPLDEDIPSVPDQATAPLPDEAILARGKANQPQQSDTEPTPAAHGRGAAYLVRELARRVSRLALKTTN
jgi:hypothetical protein